MTSKPNPFMDMFKSCMTFLLEIILWIIRIPIFKGILRAILRLLNPRKDVLMTLNEHKVYVNTFDRMMAVRFWRGSNSEKEEHNFIGSFIKEGMCVMDVGANIGYHTLHLARCVGPTGKVYAFEPDANNYRLLVKNIEVNQYHHVTAVQSAVSDHSATVSLYHCEENRGDHRIYDSKDGRKAEEVNMISLDEYFKDRDQHIDFAKIDTQGADGLVLSGMRRLIENNDRMIMICEFAPWLLKQCGSSPEKVLNEIRSLGLNIYTIEAKGRLEKLEEDTTLLQEYAPDGRYTSLLLKKS